MLLPNNACRTDTKINLDPDQATRFAQLMKRRGGPAETSRNDQAPIDPVSPALRANARFRALFAALA